MKYLLHDTSGLFIDYEFMAREIKKSDDTEGFYILLNALKAVIDTIDWKSSEEEANKYCRFRYLYHELTKNLPIYPQSRDIFTRYQSY